MDRGAWRTTTHRVAKSQTRLKQLSTHAQTIKIVNLVEQLLQCQVLLLSPEGLNCPMLSSQWLRGLYDY